MRWKQLLASITRSVDEELRLRNAYLAAENCITPSAPRPCQTDRHGAQDPRRDRPEAGEAGPGGGRDDCKARHDPGLAPYVRRPDGRLLPAAQISRTSPHRPGVGGLGGPYGPGESLVGVRSHRGSSGTSGLYD